MSVDSDLLGAAATPEGAPVTPLELLHKKKKVMVRGKPVSGWNPITQRHGNTSFPTERAWPWKPARKSLTGSGAICAPSWSMLHARSGPLRLPVKFELRSGHIGIEPKTSGSPLARCFRIFVPNRIAAAKKSPQLCIHWQFSFLTLPTRC